MSLEDEKKVNQKVGVKGLLTEEHQDEMSKILAFGENIKKSEKMLEEELWNERGNSEKFVNLLLQYVYNHEWI